MDKSKSIEIGMGSKGDVEELATMVLMQAEALDAVNHGETGVILDLFRKLLMVAGGAFKLPEYVKGEPVPTSVLYETASGEGFVPLDRGLKGATVWLEEFSGSTVHSGVVILEAFYGTKIGTLSREDLETVLREGLQSGASIDLHLLGGKGVRYTCKDGMFYIPIHRLVEKYCDGDASKLVLDMLIWELDEIVLTMDAVLVPILDKAGKEIEGHKEAVRNAMRAKALIGSLITKEVITVEIGGNAPSRVAGIVAEWEIHAHKGVVVTTGAVKMPVLTLKGESVVVVTQFILQEMLEDMVKAINEEALKIQGI